MPKREISPEERLRRVTNANRKYRRGSKTLRPKSATLNMVSVKAGRNRKEIEDLKSKFAFLENEFIQLGIRLDQFEIKKEEEDVEETPKPTKKGKAKVKAK